MPSIDTSVNVLLMIWSSFVSRVVLPLTAFVEAAWPNAYWNIGYFIFIVWMYLFHAPFRVHSNARTDWYAQLTKTMQAWCGITITLFHLAPRYMELHREQQHHDAEEGDLPIEGNPGGVFFPTFAAFLFWFLVLHRYKRAYGLKITYAATATVLFLNALLVALFLTVHYTYCEHNEAAREMPVWFSRWVSATLPPWLGAVIASTVSLWLTTNHTFWWYACPTAFEADPLFTITHLVVIGLLFVVADYLYKRGRGYDHVRGILWCVAVTPSAAPVKVRKTLRKSTQRRKAGAAVGGPVSVAATPGGGTPVSNGSVSSGAGTMRSTNEETGVDDSDDDDVLEEQLQQPDNPPSMVPWFSTLIAHTAFQLFVGSNLNFLSFDFRGIERSLAPKIFRIIPMLKRTMRANGATPSSPRAASPAAAVPTTVTEEADELWFDWVADVGDGFNSTYAIARMMAQPELQVDVPPTTRLRRHQRVARKISAAVHNVRQRGKTLRESLIHSTANLKHSFSSTLLMSDDTLSSMGGSDGDDSAASNRRGPARVAKTHSPRRSASAEVRRGRPQVAPDAQPNTPSTLAPSKRVPQRGRTTEDITHSDFDSATTSPSSVASPLIAATIMSSRRFLFGTDGSSDARHSSFLELPRGAFVLNGGDLAYPNPTDETYEQRLFSPYRDAMGPCPHLRATMQARKDQFVEPTLLSSSDAKADTDVAVIRTLSTDAALAHFTKKRRSTQPHKDDAKAQRQEDEDVVLHSTPFLFAIPGNHDWIDGLTTYRNYMIGKSWLGGWYLPQRSSYFVLELPGNWFFLCLDAGLSGDIDTEQLAYFMDVIERRMNGESCVAMCSHEPVWIYDSYHLRKEETLEKRMYKLCRKLGPRLRMRLCGDVHNYSRHTPALTGSSAPTLVVSGGGGAFLHGPRTTPITHLGQPYKHERSFPAHPSVVNFATRLFGFRIVNWQFDFIGGLLYFAIIFSALPIPLHRLSSADGVTLEPLVAASHNPMGLLASILRLTCDLIVHIFLVSHWSCIICTTIIVVMIGVIEDKVPLPKRLLFGAMWAALHIFAAVFLVALMHCLLSFVYSSKMVASSAGEWRSSMESQVSNAVIALFDCTLQALKEHVGQGGLESIEAAWAWVRGSPLATLPLFLLRAADVVEGITFLSTTVTAPYNSTEMHSAASSALYGVAFGQFAPSASRVEILLYYAHSVWFYWILATPVVSFIVGAFLLFSVHVTDTAYDPAHSAFQIEDFKHFLRFRLDRNTRELHCYVIGVDRVPKQWVRDPNCTRHHTASSKKSTAPSTNTDAVPHLQPTPSIWKPNDELWRVPGERRHTSPRLIEEFTVMPHRAPNARTTGGM
jgi:hypothetical protein